MNYGLRFDISRNTRIYTVSFCWISSIKGFLVFRLTSGFGFMDVYLDMEQARLANQFVFLRGHDTNNDDVGQKTRRAENSLVRRILRYRPDEPLRIKVEVVLL
jgi:hypothetical protein